MHATTNEDVGEKPRIIKYGSWKIIERTDPGINRPWLFRHNSGQPEGTTKTALEAMRTIDEYYGFGLPADDNWRNHVRDVSYTPEGIEARAVSMDITPKQLFLCAIGLVVAIFILFVAYDSYKRYQDRRDMEKAAEVLEEAQKKQMDEFTQEYIRTMKQMGF